MVKITEAMIQNYSTQTGVGDDPVFMWRYAAGSGKQKAYRIDLFSDGNTVYSTGKVFSDEQNNIELNLSLKEHSLYKYRITVWDENDNSYNSDEYSFITGLRNTDIEWIGTGGCKPFAAYRNFVYNGGKAYLSICVSGQFEAFINGRHVGKYAYEGSQTNFNKHIHYYTYDISDIIVRGENMLMIEAANGWYAGESGGRHFYTIDKGYEKFGDCIGVLAVLTTENERIVTDESWEVSDSRTTLANIYGSEDMDARIKPERSRAVILGERSPKGRILPINYAPPIRKYCFKGNCIDSERMIFDFGQNMSSQFRISIKGNKGQKIKLLPAEKLGEDGDILQTVNTYSELTLSGSEDVFEQRFSVNGARWYKIVGAKGCEISEFVSYFVTTSAENVGSFICSDERYNSIFRIVFKAIESNLNHLHTDCPTIEKLGWLEPNHLMARSIMYNLNVETLWDKIAMDIRDSQYDENEKDVDNGVVKHKYSSGLVPSIAPRYARFLYDGGEGSFWDILPWGSSIILAAYEQYGFYGNKRSLEKNYSAALRYIRYLNDQYDENIYPSGTHFISRGLGDWGIEQNRGCGRENVETALYYRDLMVLAEISRILNKGDENELEERAEQVKREYNSALLCYDNGVYYQSLDGVGITQTNQALPLMLGLVPDEYEEDVMNTLVRISRDGVLRCGEIGLVYILRALSSAGRNDIVHKMITRSENPSYLRFVENGETTLPEFWRDDARSRNHDMLGHIMEWFYTDVAGIRSDDAFRTVSIAPQCTDIIESFDCSFMSIRGKIRVCMKNGKLKVELPSNVSRI